MSNYSDLSAYLLAQTHRDDLVGGLAREAAGDESWPEHEDYGGLWSYLNGRYANGETFQALRTAERERRKAV